MDLPYAFQDMLATTRNPYPDTIKWESNDPRRNGSSCWLRIEEIDQAGTPAAWHKQADVTEHSKNGDYKYYDAVPGGKIEATHTGNLFTVRTSLVRRFEILISPKMVDLAKPVIVITNGVRKEYRLQGDNNFMLDQIRLGDPMAGWVNHLEIDVD